MNFIGFIFMKNGVEKTFFENITHELIRKRTIHTIS